MERAMAVVLAREASALVAPGSPLSGVTASARKARGPPSSTPAAAAHHTPPLTLPGWQFAPASSGIPASVYAAVMSKGALSYRCPDPNPQPLHHSHSHSHPHSHSHSHAHSHPHPYSQSHCHSHSHTVKRVAAALPSRKASEFVGGCHSHHHHHHHYHHHSKQSSVPSIPIDTATAITPSSAALPPHSYSLQAYPLPSPTRVVAAAAAAAASAAGGGGGAGVFLYPSGPPLPYCSATCRSCPTSSRMLLQLHSLKLGLGLGGGPGAGVGGAAALDSPSSWGGQQPSCCEQQTMAMERSSKGAWRRRSWKSRRRTRASAAVSSEQIARKSSASEPMSPPFNVLITGSTKGLGYALAKEFLRHGDNVIVCSRSEERVEVALKELKKEFPEQKVLGTTCDVRSGKSVQALADFAKSQFGYVDIWINNAGTNAYSFKTLVDTNDAALAEIVTTNALGVMLCCRQAIRTMVEQPRGGHIFNMDGAGADGNPTPRFAAYGATKRSLAQFTKSLQAELKQQSVKHVVVHNLSPGMVTTDLLMAGSDTRQAKFFINVLAEPAEVVARYLVPRIRAIPADKNKSSKYIRFLTGFKAYSQIISRLIFKVRKDRFVPED